MAKKSNPSAAILGLDIGTARIGAAAASRLARLPRPLAIIPNKGNVFAAISDLAHEAAADLIVVGLPRDMNGLETAQTREIREFAERLQAVTGIEIVFADESLSSIRAEQTPHGYKSTAKDKHLDDIAACFILEEFFNQNGES